MSPRAAVFVKFQTGGAVEQLQLQLQLGGLPSALGPRVNSPTALRQDEQRLVTASGRPLPTGPVLLSFTFGATLRQLLRPGSVLLHVACLDVFDAAAADEWLLVTRVLLSKVANVEKERVRYAVLSRWVSVPNIRALILCTSTAAPPSPIQPPRFFFNASSLHPIRTELCMTFVVMPTGTSRNAVFLNLL